MKLFTMLTTELLGLFLLPWISQVISSFGSSSLQVWVVFLIVPTGLKVWSFWIVDTYIKEPEKPSYASQNVELNNVYRSDTESENLTQQITQEQDEIGSVQTQEQGKLQDDPETLTRAQVPGLNEPLLENRIQDSLEESTHAESGFPQTMESRQGTVQTQEESGSQNGLEIPKRELVPPTLPVESNLDLEEARGKGKGKGKIPPLHSMGKGKGKVVNSGKVPGGKGKVSAMTCKIESRVKKQSDPVQPSLEKRRRRWNFKSLILKFLETQAKAADPDLCCICQENMAYTRILLREGVLVQCGRGHLFHYKCMAEYALSTEKYYIDCPYKCRNQMKFTLKNGGVTFE